MWDRISSLCRPSARPTTFYIPQYAHLSDPHSAFVRHVNGSVEALFSVAGAPTEHMDEGERAGLHERMCNLHRSLAMRSVLTITSYLVHHEAEDADVPRFLGGSDLARRIEAGYRRRLIGEGRLWHNDLFMGVLVRPPALLNKSVVGDNLADVTAEDVRELERAIGVLQSDLGADYGLRLLGLRCDAGRLFSEPAEAMSLALTGCRMPVPLPAGRLGRAICAHQPVFRRDGVIELRMPGRKIYALLLGLSVYPANTDAAMFDPLLSAPYRFSLAQSFTTMWLDEAQRLTKRKTNQMISANDPAYEQKDDLREAANDLQQRNFALGLHNLTMAVFGDDERALDRAAQAADRDLRSCGAIVSQLTWDLENGYFSMLGGTHGLHTRAVPIKTRNYAAFAPQRNFPRGWRNGRWCDHVALFTTNGGSPYYWNPHVDSEGEPGESPHLLITGPNRSGKTTLQQSLLVNVIARANATVLHWGKDRDALLLALRLGGPFFDFSVGRAAGLAPLKALDADDPADMDYLRRLTRSMMEAFGVGPLTEDTISRIDLGLRTIMRAPVRLRSFRELSAFFDDEASRLRPWCDGEALGWILDCEADRIRLDGCINVFDQTHYLDHPHAAGPIQSYLFHRGKKLADGRRLIFSSDESWKSLRDPMFRELVFDGLKTFPKKNAALWLGMQMVADALRIEGVGDTLRTQCLTHMHFPDGAADPKDYGAGGLGIPERPFQWIRRDLIGGGRGRFLLKQGSRYTPLQCSLEGDYLDDVRAELSARDETLNLMDELIAELGIEDRERLFAEFHARRKQPAWQRRMRKAATEVEACVSR